MKGLMIMVHEERIILELKSEMHIWLSRKEAIAVYEQLRRDLGLAWRCSLCGDSYLGEEKHPLDLCEECEEQINKQDLLRAGGCYGGN